jgi:hypothetical protein
VYRHEANNKLFYVHAKLLRDGAAATVPLCSDCEKSLLRSRQRPKYSIAAGYDFGNPVAIGLPPLSLLEQTVIAVSIRFGHISKLTSGQQALCGHVVAVEHDGRTRHSLLALPADGGKVGADKTNNAHVALETVRCLLIDELSMIKTTMLVAIETRLREFFRSDLPFGGLGVVLMGDFFQLPPIGKSLSAAACDEDDTGGGRLFREFSVVPFRSQMRARDDAELTNIIASFRDLKQTRCPVTNELLNKLKV